MPRRNKPTRNLTKELLDQAWQAAKASGQTDRFVGAIPLKSKEFWKSQYPDPPNFWQRLKMAIPYVLGINCLLALLVLQACAFNVKPTVIDHKAALQFSPVTADQFPSHQLPATYTIRPGDCLWKLAASQHHAFFWPLLWKANRDQILDPDVISPGQILDIPNYPSQSDLMWAQGFAADYPAHGSGSSVEIP
jgi:nucleoid-associated protein YgaU